MRTAISFSEFSELGEGQHLYIPPTAVNNTSQPSVADVDAQPDLIIFCAWLFAAPRHMAKYLGKYSLIYPRSRILVLQTNVWDMSWTPDTFQKQKIQPAVDAVMNALADCASNSGINGRKDPFVLLHALSGGGAHSVVQLAEAYHERMVADPSRAPSYPEDIPFSALILDSAPAQGRFTSAIKVALSPFRTKSSSVTRLLATPFAYVIVTSIVAMHELGVAETVVSKAWRCLNDRMGSFLLNTRANSDTQPTIVTDGQAEDAREWKLIPRTYIFSKRDDLVPAEDIFDHSTEARQAAERSEIPRDVVRDRIRTEEFLGSAHVNHVSVDGHRYWRIVQETVERGAAI